MKYIPVYTVILTTFVLIITIMFRPDSRDTVKQVKQVIQTNYQIPNVELETIDGKELKIEKSGNTYTIK